MVLPPVDDGPGDHVSSAEVSSRAYRGARLGAPRGSERANSNRVCSRRSRQSQDGSDRGKGSGALDSAGRRPCDRHCHGHLGSSHARHAPTAGHPDLTHQLTAMLRLKRTAIDIVSALPLPFWLLRSCTPCQPSYRRALPHHEVIRRAVGGPLQPTCAIAGLEAIKLVLAEARRTRLSRAPHAEVLRNAASEAFN